jgi:hypothetical protein
MKKYKLLISSLASLVLGVVLTFFFLPHFHWYLRRSTIVQLALKGGFFVLFSLVTFFVIFLVWRWVDRYSVLDRIRTPANDIKKRLPDLSQQAGVKKVSLSDWLFPLMLALIPIILALVNQEWMFTQAGETDPWEYISLGYLYFRDPTLVTHNPYKLSRVPWILIESLIRNLFTPLTAEIVLTLIIVIPASIGFYLLVSRFFNKEIGFISAALLSTYSYYMVNRTPDYHNASGGLFFIWSLYFLTLAVQSKNRHRWWFFVCGAFYGLAVHSELFLLGCFPAMIVQFFMLNWAGRKKPILDAVLFGLLGFLSITGLLGLAAVLSGHSFFFFIDQLSHVAAYQDINHSFYQPKNSGWPLQAKHLALPVAVFLFAIGWAVKEAIKIFRFHLDIDGRSWLQLGISLQMALVGLIWLALEIAKKEALIHNHYVNPVDIYAFLVFAGFLAVGWRERIPPIILGVVPLVICLSLVFSDRIFGAIGNRLFPHWQIIQPLLFYLLIFAVLLLLKRQPLAILSVVVLMSLGNIVGIAANVNSFSLISPSELSLGENQCHKGRDGYLSVIDTSNYLMNFGWQRTHLWWDDGELMPVNNCPESNIKIAQVGNSVTLTGIQVMKDHEPCPPIDWISSSYYQQLTKHNDVVSVITNHPSTANKMLVKLRTYGNWLLANKGTIAHGDIRFSIYVFSLDGKTP